MDNSNFQVINNWLKENGYSCVDAIKDSDVYVGLVTQDYVEDPLCAFQLGLSILMDKPICLIVGKNEKIPKALVRIAKHVERIDFNIPGELNRAANVIKSFTDRAISR